MDYLKVISISLNLKIMNMNIVSLEFILIFCVTKLPIFYNVNKLLIANISRYDVYYVDCCCMLLGRGIIAALCDWISVHGFCVFKKSIVWIEMKCSNGSTLVPLDGK